MFAKRPVSNPACVNLPFFCLGKQICLYFITTDDLKSLMKREIFENTSKSESIG